MGREKPLTQRPLQLFLHTWGGVSAVCLLEAGDGAYFESASSLDLRYTFWVVSKGEGLNGGYWEGNGNTTALNDLLLYLKVKGLKTDALGDFMYLHNCFVLGP